MNGTAGLVTTALGGLALFVYGMRLMSDGLKETAGSKLKTALGYMTRNRFFAIMTGLCVTALIQSSSATSVMTVGFVNAGLLSLTQAIGVIFGANMGTTVTGQLVSLKLGDMAVPALILGVAGMMAARRKFTKGIWRTVLGFGFLFYGMTMMGQELKSLTKVPGFTEFFSLFDCTPSQSGFLPAGSVLGAILVGTICTMLVQSSSATIGITIALAEAGVINIWTAVPIVLGDNIGTTVTAGLASIGTNVNAKRTALAHALFNLLGTLILISTFVMVFTGSSGTKAPAFFHLVNMSADGDVFAGANPGRHVAMAHTLFNVTNVIVLAAFIPLLARICERIIRTRDDSRTLILEPSLLVSPSLALEASVSALADMTRRAWTIASVAINKSLGKTSAAPESIEAAESEVDGMREQLKAYLVSISQQKLSSGEARTIPELLHCANDAERISDLALKVYRKSDLARGALEGKASLSDAVQTVSKVRQLAHATIDALLAGRPCGIDAVATSAEIDAAIKKTSRGLWEDPKARGAHTREFLAVLSVFKCLKDITRHLANIAGRAEAIHPSNLV
ncbi:MAG: Na/Pi cotransporter family protein [Kiritimatiellae bacterium]|nr:Na/Pi cotransporter family protein [Kiritimatiellia bacterium]